MALLPEEIPGTADAATFRTTQTIATQLRLRDLIVGGALEPGERLSELSMVERLGASRTPVRAALARLADEGLLEPLPSGGFAVRSFSEQDLREAIELRGTLEGMAARFAAERGAPPSHLAGLRQIVAQIDATLSPGVLSGPAIDVAVFSRYVVLNERFHALLVEAAGSRLLARKIAQAVVLPFASPSSFVMAQRLLAEAGHSLIVAQEQHRSVLDAIADREGSRAEALMREHARLARRNLDLALSNQGMLAEVPGARLIRPRRSA